MTIPFVNIECYVWEGGEKKSWNLSCVWRGEVMVLYSDSSCEKSWYFTVVLHVRRKSSNPVPLLLLCVRRRRKEVIILLPCVSDFPSTVGESKSYHGNLLCEYRQSLLSLFYVKYWSNVFKKRTFFFSHEGLEARPISASCKINVFFPLRHMNCRVMEWL